MREREASEKLSVMHNVVLTSCSPLVAARMEAEEDPDNDSAAPEPQQEAAPHAGKTKPAQIFAKISFLMTGLSADDPQRRPEGEEPAEKVAIFFRLAHSCALVLYPSPSFPYCSCLPFPLPLPFTYL